MMFALSRDDWTGWFGLGIAILTFVALVYRYLLRPVSAFAARLSRFMDQAETHFFARDGNPSKFDQLVDITANHEIRIASLEYERNHPK